MTLGILIPAAGASSRMGGRDKLLEGVDGRPLLARQIQTALKLRCPVLVTLPAKAMDRMRVILGLAADHRVIPEAEEGISASLRAGAHWAQDNGYSGLMVVLPDLPDVTFDDLRTIAKLHAAHTVDILRATDANGRFGHPTVIPARCYEGLRGLTGDTGARALLSAEKVRPCPLPGNRATTDLDTPEDWATWRAARSNSS